MSVDDKESPGQPPPEDAGRIEKVKGFLDHLHRGGKSPERPLVLKARIPDKEKEILERKFGASFYTLTGQTIEGQKNAREARGLPAFWGIVEAEDSKSLLVVPSPKIEVAYFVEPRDFFVPGSFGKDTATQEAKAVVDAKRYGLKGITQIIPDQASVFTELIFQHLVNHPGVWLFGSEYGKAQDKIFVYGRTKNPVNPSGFRVATVTTVPPSYGISIVSSIRDKGEDNTGAMRLVVAVETKSLLDRLRRGRELPESGSAINKSAEPVYPAEALSPEDLLRQQENLLRKQMYEILGRAVNPTEAEKGELREKKGLVFLPIAIPTTDAEPGTKDYRPVTVEVGFIESELFLPDSFDKPRYRALQMITDYSNALAADFPAFRAIALPVAGYIAADKEYALRNPGQVLFKRGFAWGLDNFSFPFHLPAAHLVGRLAPDDRIDFITRDPRYEYWSNQGGVPAIVKIDTK